MSMKYLVPALAVAGKAAAASCSTSGTMTIHTPADATALATCQKFTGNVEIASDASGVIDLPGVKEITGSLSSNGSTGLTQISAENLETIGDAFMLTGATILSGLVFPVLSTVGSINWDHLAGLQQLAFSTDGVQMANSVSIQDTQLTSLDGINLQTVDSMTLSNNRYLNDVTMQLGNVSTLFLVEANGRNFSIAFPNLIWGNELTFNNVSTISMPSLTAVNGSMGFVANYFSSFTAPNLTMVGGSLSFNANGALTNISCPMLTEVDGGLELANNTQLAKINGFPAVTTVGGAVDFSGNFTEVDLPALNDVKGAFNLQSSENITATCNHFQSLSGTSSVIQGTFTCYGEKDNPGGVGSAPSGTGEGGSKTSGSAASGIIIPGATGLLGVLAAVFGML